MLAAASHGANSSEEICLMIRIWAWHQGQYCVLCQAQILDIKQTALTPALDIKWNQMSWPHDLCLQLSMHKERYSLDQKDRYIPTTIDSKNHCSGTADQWFQRRKNESEMKPLLTFKGCNLLLVLLLGQTTTNSRQQLHFYIYTQLWKREILFVLLWSQNYLFQIETWQPSLKVLTYLYIYLRLKSLFQNSATWRDAAKV